MSEQSERSQLKINTAIAEAVAALFPELELRINAIVAMNDIQSINDTALYALRYIGKDEAVYCFVAKVNLRNFQVLDTRQWVPDGGDPLIRQAALVFFTDSGVPVMMTDRLITAAFRSWHY
jgi:hypothetical protein